MSKSLLLVREIKQKNNYVFSITWNDGVEQEFRLSHLQRVCPCANCVDENTGKRLIDPQRIQEDVRAIEIRNMGRYALQVQFTSGCSTGIYSFDLLRHLKEKNYAI
jgi:DUF971 family protein